MKKLALLFVGMGLAGASAFAQADATRLKGAWELIRYDYGGGKKPSGTKEVKLITERHFVWINYDAKGIAFAEGGGTYTLNGSVLTEHLDYTDKQDKSILGNKDQLLTVNFDNDMFTSTGTLTNGQKITEVWKRIE